jgi:hypothetical protein
LEIIWIVDFELDWMRIEGSKPSIFYPHIHSFALTPHV